MVSKQAVEEVSAVTPQVVTPTPVGLKTAADVLEALQGRYSGVLKKIENFSYIPWSVSVRLANGIFGYLGWSSTVVSCDYTECMVDVNVGTYREPQYEPREFKGFKSIVRVEVQVYDPILGIIRTHHDGVGYGPIQAQGNKNPMDGACKAAKSDGISTAIKHYGDAFGLFLYDKDEDQGTAAPASGGSSSSGARSAATSSGKGATEPQKEHIRKQFGELGLTGEQVEGISYETAKFMLDGIWKDHRDKAEVMREAGFTPVSRGAADKLPIPRGRS